MVPSLAGSLQLPAPAHHFRQAGLPTNALVALHLQLMALLHRVQRPGLNAQWPSGRQLCHQCPGGQQRQPQQTRQQQLQHPLPMDLMVSQACPLRH